MHHLKNGKKVSPGILREAHTSYSEAGRQAEVSETARLFTRAAYCLLRLLVVVNGLLQVLGAFPTDAVEVSGCQVVLGHCPIYWEGKKAMDGGDPLETGMNKRRFGTIGSNAFLPVRLRANFSWAVQKVTRRRNRGHKNNANEV
jgi:hypothetical protein